MIFKRLSLEEFTVINNLEAIKGAMSEEIFEALMEESKSKYLEIERKQELNRAKRQNRPPQIIIQQPQRNIIPFGPGPAVRAPNGSNNPGQSPRKKKPGIKDRFAAAKDWMKEVERLA